MAREGVTCITCHRVGEEFTKVNGERRIIPGTIHAPVYGSLENSAFAEVVARKGELQLATSEGEVGRPMHGAVAQNSQISKSEFCVSCHQVAVNLGIKLEVVWDQYRNSPAAAKGITCQECHMSRVPGRAEGYDKAPSAMIGGEAINPDRRHSNHAFYGPGYTASHPGIFPHNPKASRWTIQQWLEFDYRSGWGTGGFEKSIGRIAAPLENIERVVRDVTGGALADAVGKLEAASGPVSTGEALASLKIALMGTAKSAEPAGGDSLLAPPAEGDGLLAPSGGGDSLLASPAVSHDSAPNTANKPGAVENGKAVADAFAVLSASVSGGTPSAKVLDAARVLGIAVVKWQGHIERLVTLLEAGEKAVSSARAGAATVAKGISREFASLRGSAEGVSGALKVSHIAFGLDFPDAWRTVDDRMDAREIVNENLKATEEKRHLRRQVMENGSHVDGPFFETKIQAGQDLDFHYVLSNTNMGHNLPSGSLGAQPELWLNVALIGPDNKKLWESGYVDANGDMADLHSLEVAAGKIKHDDQLFNLQTKFLTTNVKGTDREMYLPVNVDIDQMPLIRPANVPTTVINHPPFIRMEGRSLPPGGQRKAKYSVPGHLLRKPGTYKLAVRLRSRAEPIYFMRFVEATKDMEQAMNEWMLDVHSYTAKFEVK